MKIFKIMFLTLALLVGMGLSVTRPQAEAAQKAAPAVIFHPFSKARELAQQHNKPIFIFFWSEDCYYCRKFNKEVLAIPRVADFLNKHYVSVSVDLNNDREKLASVFKVRAVPNLWFFDSEGQALTNLPGFVPAELFEPILEFFQTGAYQKMDFDAFRSQRKQQL